MYPKSFYATSQGQICRTMMFLTLAFATEITPTTRVVHNYNTTIRNDTLDRKLSIGVKLWTSKITIIKGRVISNNILPKYY